MNFQKKRKFRRVGGSRLWNSEGMGGVTHSGISEGKGGGGLKHGSRPWLRMDIFWNCPFLKCPKMIENIDNFH